MPTPNMTCSNPLHALHLPVTTLLRLALNFFETQFTEQRFWLLVFQLQRHVSSLHTFLLISDGGFQGTKQLPKQ
jgi:hypothetical protein